MKFDTIIAGVGGQGALSSAAIIAGTAVEAGLFVKQTEVHGMAQRGGSVVAHLRLSDVPIAADIVPLGTADLLLGVESLEGLRLLPYLAEDGWAIVARTRVENMVDYPEQAEIERALSVVANLLILDTEDLARTAGSVRAANTVLLGAAADLFPVAADTMKRAVMERFASKGEKIVVANEKAFTAGRHAMSSGAPPKARPEVQVGSGVHA
jgi:indolepyruvate ferredoxin oxidoreductase, beta subunit